MKQTKKNFNKSANTSNSHASQHSRHSLVESFKSLVQNQISIRSNEDGGITPRNADQMSSEKKEENHKEKKKIKRLDSEVAKDMSETNKLIMIVIENKREKTAMYDIYIYIYIV